MSDINWNQKRDVFVNRTFSIALVKVGRNSYMEFDDYREGGPQAECLPAYSEFLGTFTNAEISNMDYPDCT